MFQREVQGKRVPAADDDRTAGLSLPRAHEGSGGVRGFPSGLAAQEQEGAVTARRDEVATFEEVALHTTEVSTWIRGGLYCLQTVDGELAEDSLPAFGPQLGGLDEMK